MANSHPNNLGRPTKFTKDRIEKFYGYLRKYLPYTIACKGAGFSYQTFSNWYKIGEELDNKITNGDITREEIDPYDLEYLIFFETINEIDATIAEELIEGYVKESTQGAARRFLLNHRFNPEFGEKSEVNHTGNVDVSVSWKELVKGKEEE